MRFQKILCPVDFSACSDHAIEVAAQLAKPANAELVLAHVRSMPSLPTEVEYPTPQPLLDQLVEEDKRLLATAAGRASDLGVARISTNFLVGAPWDRIVAILRDDRQFELVVMGTHGRTGLSRILLGSVAEKVIRHAPCPVLVTRRAHAGAFHRVLCPIDFSEASRRAAVLAGQLVDPKGSLTLLYVIELPVSYQAHASMTEFLRDLDVRSTRMLDRFADTVREQVAVPVSTSIRVGSAGAQALAAIEHDPPYDLVAVGSHGRTGLRRALLGSVAEKVVRHAPCAVLVARDPD